MKVKEIRNQLQKGNVKFTVNGITKYCAGVDGEYGMNLKVFKVMDGAGSIFEDGVFLTNFMNVNKWGPTCVTLFTYDMLGKMSVGKIKYSEITIID